MNYIKKSSNIWRSLIAVFVLSVLFSSNALADDTNIADEVINDMLTIREELKASATTTTNAVEQRDYFVNTISNEMGFDCKTVSEVEESINLSIDTGEPEPALLDNVDNLEIVSTKSSIDDLNQVAAEIVQITSSYNDKVYTLAVQDVRDFKSGATIEVEEVPIYLGSIQNILSSDIEYPDWDTRHRYKDILILEDILVNQLGVSKSVASAIIGNICYEGSFAQMENSTSSLSDINEVNSRLGAETIGFGVAQWTSKFRQNKLKEYYNIASQDLDWDTATVIAECMYLYNELKVSNLLGDMSQECDIENATGKLAYEYLAYADRSNEWLCEDGRYISVDCPRYKYAMKIYRYMTGE